MAAACTRLPGFARVRAFASSSVRPYKHRVLVALREQPPTTVCLIQPYASCLPDHRLHARTLVHTLTLGTPPLPAVLS